MIDNRKQFTFLKVILGNLHFFKANLFILKSLHNLARSGPHGVTKLP